MNYKLFSYDMKHAVDGSEGGVGTLTIGRRTFTATLIFGGNVVVVFGVVDIKGKLSGTFISPDGSNGFLKLEPAESGYFGKCGFEESSLAPADSAEISLVIT